MVKLFSCPMCNSRERYSSSESAYCFVLFENRLALKYSVITDCFYGFIKVQPIKVSKAHSIIEGQQHKVIQWT